MACHIAYEYTELCFTQLRAEIEKLLICLEYTSVISLL